jgi:hypothetical protein
MSGAETRIATSEIHFFTFASSFNSIIVNLKQQSKVQKETQFKQKRMLSKILELLEHQLISSKPPDKDNNLFSTLDQSSISKSGDPWLIRPVLATSESVNVPS